MSLVGMPLKRQVAQAEGACFEQDADAQDMQRPEACRFRAQFWKTELCKHYKRGCRKGDSCPFAHGNHELMIRPDLRKTSMCQDFANGICPFRAEDCEFAHTRTELQATNFYRKTVLCKDFAKGRCNLGDNCRHAHTMDASLVSNTDLRLEKSFAQKPIEKPKHRSFAPSSRAAQPPLVGRNGNNDLRRPRRPTATVMGSENDAEDVSPIGVRTFDPATNTTYTIPWPLIEAGLTLDTIRDMLNSTYPKNELYED